MLRILTDRVLFGVLLGAYMKVKVAFNHLDVVFRVRVLLPILLMGDQSKMRILLGEATKWFKFTYKLDD